MTKSHYEKMASIWSGWKITSKEEFQAWLPDIRLNPSVPKEVSKPFETIRKLLLYSYSEYDFLDVAHLYALIVFEIALQSQYKRITGKKYKNNLEKLIRWGAEQGLFEYEEPAIQNLRKLRNIIVHPKEEQQFGFLCIGSIQRTADIVNGMYEDIDLRRERLAIEQEVNDDLDRLTKRGAMFEIDKIEHIIFIAKLLLYNNKTSPSTYHWVFWPVFDLKEHDGVIDEGKPISIMTTDFTREKDTYRFHDSISKREILFRRITDPDREATFNDWKTSFNSQRSILRFILQTRIGDIQNRLISEMSTN